MYVRNCSYYTNNRGKAQGGGAIFLQEIGTPAPALAGAGFLCRHCGKARSVGWELPADMDQAPVEAKFQPANLVASEKREEAIPAVPGGLKAPIWELPLQPRPTA